MPLIKQDIVNQLVNKIGFKQNEASELVDAFFTEIKEELAHHNTVKISGFGNFEVLNKTKRMGRNPKTKEEYPICARKAISFKPGVKLKKRTQETAIKQGKLF